MFFTPSKSNIEARFEIWVVVSVWHFLEHIVHFGSKSVGHFLEHIVHFGSKSVGHFLEHIVHFGSKSVGHFLERIVHFDQKYGPSGSRALYGTLSTF